MDGVLDIDPNSLVPRHRQVYDAIRAAIRNGELRTGARLPASRALAAELSVSRATVAAAYDQLQSEGYIEGRHGSGTYVASGLPDDGLLSAAQPATVPTRLSDWGRRVASAHGGQLSVAPSAIEPIHDFRPNRVALDLFPWDAWRSSIDRALTEDRPLLAAYPPPSGHPGLREAIAGHVAEYRSVVCSPGQVVIVSGVQQGLNLLAHLLLDAGDPVAVEDPGYPAARLALESRGLRVSRIGLDDEGLSVDALERSGRQRLMHVTPSHQDPTGGTLSLARRVALLDLAARMGSFVVEDDYDSEFRYEGRPVESLQGLDVSGRVIYAGTFSKSLLGGLRIGFLILPRDLVDPFIAAKSVWDSGTSMLEQAALAQFIHSGEFGRHIRRMRRIYRQRRDALVRALSATFGGRVIIGNHSGGLNMLIGFDVPLATDTLQRRALSAGIGLMSAAPYYADPPARPTFLFGFAALDEESIGAGVAGLAAVVADAIDP